MQDKHEKLERVQQMVEEIASIKSEDWFHHELFTLQWWVLLGILTLPWIIWWKLVDKSKIIEVLLTGLFTIITATILCEIGEDLSFWGYPIEMIYFGHSAMPYNFGIVPVTFMLLYQYCVTWKSFSIGIMSMAVIFAFIGEPLVQMLGIYLLIKWKFIYSFLYYLTNGFLIKGFMHKILKITISNR